MFTNPWYGGAGPPPDNSASASPAMSSKSGQEPSKDGKIGAPNGQTVFSDMPSVKEHLVDVQAKLKAGWTVHVSKDGRLYYCK